MALLASATKPVPSLAQNVYMRVYVVLLSNMYSHLKASVQGKYCTQGSSSSNCTHVRVSYL